MSNQAVGNVYQTIIDEVINSSRVDFEENGVEESVLEELRQGWQKKLSQLDVARFPWDPKPDPPPQAPAASAAGGSAQPHAQAQFSPQMGVPHSLSMPTGGQQLHDQNGINNENMHIKNDPAVKQEPGVAGAAYPGYNTGLSSEGVAANRASQHLAAQYGPRATNSINAIHHGQQAQSQPQQPVLPQQSSQPGQQPALTQQQQHDLYRQKMATTTAQQQQQQQQQQPANGLPHFGAGQTDGAGDDSDDSDDSDEEMEGVLMKRSAAGDLQELGRVEIDRMLHEKILAKAKSMEGGGLMLPLKEATRHQGAASRSSKDKGKQTAAFDGGDDEEEDEDAINSDLDDPDEDRDDDEVDDEGLGHIMLCMYDKVQRVKNKWKCTLKDGVLTVNGKEYVFHKATGEYEW